MTQTLQRPVISEPLPLNKPRRRVGDRILFGYTWLIILWLAFPIGIMILFSFNDTRGRYNTTWQGFTFKWYGELNKYPDLSRALVTSLLVALVTMIIAGALGTLVGVALGRYRFRGHGTTNLIMFATISSPELVMGASLLSLFVSSGVGLGILTIIIAHVMFSISFVAVVVRARVLTLDRYTEEAARDLGASAWSTFWLVTFPMIFPAVLSGGLLAFALSVDDFVITNFTAGTVVTFPLWIWGATRLGMPPQVNVMGTLIFAGGVLIAVDVLALAAPQGHRRSRGRTGRRRAGPVLVESAGRSRADRAVAYPRDGRPGRDRGGFTGLWTGIAGQGARPRRDVVLLEAQATGWAASGRNGGFCSASLTHGAATGWPASRRRWPSWSASAGRTSTRSRRRSPGTASSCDFERTGELNVATQPWQLAGLTRPAATRSDRGPGPGRAGFAHLSGRRMGPRRLRHGRPGPAGLGPARGLPQSGRADPRADTGDPHRPYRRSG